MGQGYQAGAGIQPCCCQRQLKSRFPMFSSGLFGSCCSQDWDSADFCRRLRTPAFLKGTQPLRAPHEAARTPDAGRGAASPK